jgi:hypothetical protein
MNKGELSMNTKQALIALAIAATVTATAAIAQSTTPAATPTSASTVAAPESDYKGKRPMKFQDRKAKALQSLEKRAAKIQEQQTCAQAATDGAALDKCLPRHKGKGGRHKRGKGAEAAEAPAKDSASSGK